MIAVAALVILRVALPAWPESLSALALAEYAGLLWPTVVMFVGALVAMLKYRIDVVWVIPPLVCAVCWCSKFTLVGGYRQTQIKHEEG